MALVLDPNKDILYRQGKKEGSYESKIEIAENLFSIGLDLLTIQQVTNLPMDILKKLADKG